MSELLTEEEQVERIKGWWSENSTSVLVGLIAAIAVIGGWKGYQSYTEGQEASASDAYRSYLDERGLGGSTEAALAAIEADHGGTAYRVFTLLFQAKDAAAEENWEQAAEYLTQVIDDADDPVLEDVARIRLAKIQYQLDQLDATLATLGAITSEGFRGAVAEMTGDVHQARGERAQAREAYQAAVDVSSETPRREILELKLASVSNDS